MSLLPEQSGSREELLDSLRATPAPVETRTRQATTAHPGSLS
jgi:hypothetical protein